MFPNFISKLKNLFLNKEEKFDKKLNGYIKSMVEISFEYVGWNGKEVETIYIFCSTEEGYFFNFFYLIKGSVVAKHKVNDFLDQKCNVEPSQQEAALEVGLRDLEGIIELFKKDKREVPTIVKIKYDTHSSKMDTNLNYEKKLTGKDLMPEDLMTEWMNSIKASK